MSRSTAARVVPDEPGRIQAEYRRRARELDADRYAAWRPDVLAERACRLRAICGLMRAAGVFPREGDRCLEIGYGTGGWLFDVLGWGVVMADLHGIELDGERARLAHARLPDADLRVGNATRIPWQEGYFRFVVISTVVSSVLDVEMRRAICSEAIRVTAPGGSILWYDIRRNNPANPHVRKVGAAEIRTLFGGCAITLQSSTLAPPLARLVTGRAPLLSRALESLPPLRTHLCGLIRKPGSPS
jgi:ubiquinone/menaquinone biosynthesis C-methylase UbiE